MKTLLLSALIGFSLLGSVVAGVRAQETPPAEVPQVETTDAVNLQLLYRQQLLDYQSKERQYSIAKQDYQRLQTLAALEEAVAATKAVMLARADVLSTYLQLLSQTLSNLTTIDAQLKESNLARMSGLISQLTDHRAKVETVTDRFGIRERVTEFEPMAVEIEDASYQALTLIGQGKIQTVAFGLTPLAAELEQLAASNSGVTKQETQEIVLALQSAQKELDNSLITIKNPKLNRNRELYTTVNRQLNQVVVYLKQAIAFMAEVGT